MSAEATNTVLITGGAGFIGSHLAERLLARPGTRVKILDNLSRTGGQFNLDWLRTKDAANNLEFIHADVRDANAVNLAMAGVSEVYHLAAQGSVTSSIADPLTDIQVNALGTLNVLEAARHSRSRPFVLFTSTNKVYGALESIPLIKDGTHYRAKSREFHGVSESQGIEFHSPYGCSKGTADQYVRDYARVYGLPTVVFRASSIAGPRQVGTEDQGWIAHLLSSALAGRPITIYGDGLQVRDILHVQDLIDAMLAARKHLQFTRGKIYNVGGGPLRAVSVLEVVHTIEKKIGRKITVQRRAARPGDQLLYISDTTRLSYDTGWNPRLGLADILDGMQSFLLEANQPLPAASPASRIFEEVA